MVPSIDGTFPTNHETLPQHGERCRKTKTGGSRWMSRSGKKSRERTIGPDPHDGGACALLIVTVVEI
jgi:hypothetical protein